MYVCILFYILFCNVIMQMQNINMWLNAMFLRNCTSTHALCMLVLLREKGNT